MEGKLRKGKISRVVVRRILAAEKSYKLSRLKSPK